MTIPGGGAFQVGPGQISDDSELALSLAWSIVSSKMYDPNCALLYYQNWLQSNPFDVGTTCRYAFSSPQRLNYMSQSNGALMRVWPIAIHGHRKGEEYIVKIARQDALVSHPHKICQDCNVLYCLAISRLLNGDNVSECLEYITTYMKNEQNDICKEVQEWMEEAISMEDDDALDCTKLIGWCKWAFILAFHYLSKGYDYETSIKRCLLKGGDTDTNACIVGGLIGAYVGMEGIPDYMKNPVLEFNCTSKNMRLGYIRPDKFRTAHYKYLCEKIV
jgi:ADP-ribosylglycohydrolase